MKVPAKGEVWCFRHYCVIDAGQVVAAGQGRVTIDVDPSEVRGQVVFRYHGSGASGVAESVEAFVRNYVFLARDEASALAAFGPQVRQSARRLTDMPVRLGTAVD